MKHSRSHDLEDILATAHLRPETCPPTNAPPAKPARKAGEGHSSRNAAAKEHTREQPCGGHGHCHAFGIPNMFIPLTSPGHQCPSPRRIQLSATPIPSRVAPRMILVRTRRGAGPTDWSLVRRREGQVGIMLLARVLAAEGEVGAEVG